MSVILLGGVGAVVHEEELKVLDVVDEESLVAGGHHVAGLLVGTVADLLSSQSACFLFTLPRLSSSFVLVVGWT